MRRDFEDEARKRGATSFGSAASTDHAASLSGNSVMRKDMPHPRGNTAGFKLCLIALLLVLSGCAVGRAPVRAYHALYCDKMNADGVRCDWWATPCGRLNCGGK